LKKIRELRRGRYYLKAGIGIGAFLDDSFAVNVHGTVPAAWVKAAMLVLNLVVWLDAVVRLG
jgi:hypothetical protein